MAADLWLTSGPDDDVVVVVVVGGEEGGIRNSLNINRGSPVSVDSGRETATQLKPLCNLSSPPFLSLVGTTVKIIIKFLIIKG